MQFPFSGGEKTRDENQEIEEECGRWIEKRLSKTCNVGIFNYKVVVSQTSIEQVTRVFTLSVP